MLARAIETRATKTSLGGFQSARIVDQSTGRPITAANNTAGASVNAETAAKVTAVYCGIRILAETIAQLPMQVYSRDGEGRKPLPDHPVSKLFAVGPNPEMTAAEWREYVTARSVYDGDAYCEIEWNAAGEPAALWPLPANCVAPVRMPSGALAYDFRSPVDGRVYRFDAANILRIPGFSLNGVTGVRIWDYLAESIGIAMATERHAAAYYGNSATPGGVLESPQPLGDKARANLRESWEMAHKGLDRAHRVALLEGGIKFTPVATSAKEAMLIEARQFTISEIARIMRIPPHLLYDLSRATFSNIEQQSLDFITQTVTPMACRQEQRVAKSLLLPSERAAGLYVRYNLSGLARGDMAARGAFYNTLYHIGAISPDEIRALEDWTPLPDQLGQVWARPMNTAFVGPGADVEAEAEDDDDEPAPTVAPAGDDMPADMDSEMPAESVRRAFAEPLAQSIGRVRGRFVRDCRRIAERLLPRARMAEYRAEADTVMAGYKQAFAADVGPLLRAYVALAGGDAADYITRAAIDDEAVMRFALEPDRVLLADPSEPQACAAAAADCIAVE